MKKSVIIGSLVAGAFLLPTLANAGVASGRCDKCHTMHASQNGSTTNPNAVLLVGSGCTGCHTGFSTNNATGLGTNGAPQVDDPNNTSMLSGGYFNTTGNDNEQHNITGYIGQDAAMIRIPGQATAYDGTTVVDCNGCHAASGGHHSTGGAYRMLSYGNTDVTGTEGANYGVGRDRSANTYHPATMNGLCGSCHPAFHGTGNDDAQLGSFGAGWIRHPVNITLVAATATYTAGNYSANYLAADGGLELDLTPLGEAGGTKDTIMCLTCHMAHGSANSDILAFSYGEMNAGDGLVQDGCEYCHSYAAGGM